MLFLFLDSQLKQFPKNLGTFKINYFLPKLLESYGTLYYALSLDREKLGRQSTTKGICGRHVIFKPWVAHEYTSGGGVCIPHMNYHECKKWYHFEASAYILYIRERCCFSLVCTPKRAIKSFEVKVDVQKGPRRFSFFHFLRLFFTTYVLVSSTTIFIHCLHVVIVLNDYHVSSC